MFSLKNVFIAAWACDSNTGSNFSSNWALCGRMFWGRRQLMSSIDQTNSSLHSSLGVDTWKRLGLEINGRCSLSWSCDSNGFRTDLALWLIDGLWLAANDEVLCESRIYFAIFFGVVVVAGVRIVRDGTSRCWSVLTGVCSIWDGDRRELKVERVKRNIESWRFVVDQMRRERIVKRNGKKFSTVDLGYTVNLFLLSLLHCRVAANIFFFGIRHLNLKIEGNETFTEYSGAASAAAHRQLLFVHYHGRFACRGMFLRFRWVWN